MCLGAIYWARPDRVVFACTRGDAANAGFDDQLIYDELPLPYSVRRIRTEYAPHSEGQVLFSDWKNKTDKLPY